MTERTSASIVAVVDDDPGVLRSLEYLLESADYSVRLFASGGELLDSGCMYQIDCLIDFSHPMIGVQNLFVELGNGAFSREIAAARTFGFTNEIEALRKANLIRGGSLDNAIVLTPEGMLNETGLRFRDEFVRHKILDIIGDLALLGMPILGKVVAERSGHIMHAGLMSKLLQVRSAWDIVDM